MKRNLLLFVLCAVVNICYAQESIKSATERKTTPSEPKETIVFDKTEHDFKTISETGGEVEHKFTFKNTSDAPLVIIKVQATCGCTAADYSKEPVAPGKKGFIKIKYNPKGRANDFSQMVTVFSNGTPSRISLKIKGHIKGTS